MNQYDAILLIHKNLLFEMQYLFKVNHITQLSISDANYYRFTDHKLCNKNICKMNFNS